MTATVSSVSRDSAFEYPLGYSNGEHDRLVRQAELVAPITERVFREAGIARGQRVLDLGSGLGDVSMIVARLVGPSGEVVGIERDSNSIARARERVKAAGVANVKFIHTDASHLPSEEQFDAAVGRFILMFLPNPVAVLRSVVRVLRPFGVLVFQEPSWTPMLAMAAPDSLWSAVLNAIRETLLRAQANTEMGIDLYRHLQEIGIPAPQMHFDMVVGADARLTELKCNLLCSMRPLAEQYDVSLTHLEPLDTLAERVQAEIQWTNTPVSGVPMVSVWSSKVV